MFSPSCTILEARRPILLLSELGMEGPFSQLEVCYNARTRLVVSYGLACGCGTVFPCSETSGLVPDELVDDNPSDVKDQQAWKREVRGLRAHPAARVPDGSLSVGVGYKDLDHMPP